MERRGVRDSGLPLRARLRGGERKNLHWQSDRGQGTGRSKGSDLCRATATRPTYSITVACTKTESPWSGSLGPVEVSTSLTDTRDRLSELQTIFTTPCIRYQSAWPFSWTLTLVTDGCLAIRSP